MSDKTGGLPAFGDIPELGDPGKGEIEVGVVTMRCMPLFCCKRNKYAK